MWTLIAAVAGCSGADKSMSSDLTDQNLEKPSAVNPTNVIQKQKRTKDVKGLNHDKTKGPKIQKGPKKVGKKRKDDGVDWRVAMASSTDKWSDELKNQITAAGYDLNEVAEKIKKRQESTDKKSQKKLGKKRKDDGVDWRAAMASSPDKWSDELKNQITAAGYDLNEVAEKIKKRQE
ncbi:MAG: hypothetical protein CME21_15295, partial [Gemmatimonadetes bacterium]|nr:hypothetical protein [Gemmatimonadota bacterium]